MEIPFDHGRTPPEKVKSFLEREEAVAAAVLRIQVHELPCLAGVFRDGREPEFLDSDRTETFLVLRFHGIEDAPVGIEADEKFPAGFELYQVVACVHAGGSPAENESFKPVISRERGIRFPNVPIYSTTEKSDDHENTGFLAPQKKASDIFTTLIEAGLEMTMK
jgi:hypothetical protein